MIKHPIRKRPNRKAFSLRFPFQICCVTWLEDSHVSFIQLLGHIVPLVVVHIGLGCCTSWSLPLSKLNWENRGRERERNWKSGNKMRLQQLSLLPRLFPSLITFPYPTVSFTCPFPTSRGRCTNIGYSSALSSPFSFDFFPSSFLRSARLSSRWLQRTVSPAYSVSQSLRSRFDDGI